MKLSNKSQALHDLIAPAVAACGVELWGIEFIPQGKRSLLRIYIDKAIEESAAPVLNEDGCNLRLIKASLQIHLSFVTS